MGENVPIVGTRNQSQKVPEKAGGLKVSRAKLAADGLTEAPMAPFKWSFSSTVSS